MTRLSLIATLTLAAMTAATSAFAHDLDGRVGQREQMQASRIEQGRRDGSITWREGLQLRAEQRRIDAAEKAFLGDDGRIDSNEFRQLKAMQDEAAQHIRSEARDGWYRPSWLPRIGW